MSAQGLSIKTVSIAAFGLAAMAGLLFFFQAGREAPDSGPATLIVARDLPAHMRIEGETAGRGIVTPLTLVAQEDGTHLQSANPGGAIILRLIDTTTRQFYDLGVTDTISLSGFAPRSAVTLTSQGGTHYNAVPMDWSGRITLPRPAQAPLWLSIIQGGHVFEIGIMQPAGRTS